MAVVAVLSTLAAPDGPRACSSAADEHWICTASFLHVPRHGSPNALVLAESWQYLRGSNREFSAGQHVATALRRSGWHAWPEAGRRHEKPTACGSRHASAEEILAIARWAKEQRWPRGGTRTHCLLRHSDPTTVFESSDWQLAFAVNPARREKPPGPGVSGWRRQPKAGATASWSRLPAGLSFIYAP